MNRKQTYLILEICLIIFIPLCAEIKDTLSGTSYSRIENDKSAIREDRKPWISVYGSQRGEPRSDIISLYFQYIVPVDLIDTTKLNGSSTLTQGDAMMQLEASADNVVTTTITTKKAINYSPGHEIMAMFTAMFPTTTIAGYYERYIGMFTANDGFSIGERKGIFGIQYVQNDVPLFIPQSSFNIDKLDGTGKSGMIWDQTKLNIFYIAFGWLGAAPIEFGIASEPGVWVPFHRILYCNLFNSPSVHNPSLPLAMSVCKNGTSSDLLSIKTASWDATITGLEHPMRNYSAGISNQKIDSDLTPGFVPVLSVRNRSTYAHKSNTGHMRLSSLNVGSRKTGNLLRIQMLKEATLADGTWEYVDEMLSITEKNSSATEFSDTGTLVLQFALDSRNETTLNFKKNGVNIEVYAGETLSIAAEETGDGSVNIDVALNWEEYF